MGRVRIGALAGVAALVVLVAAGPAAAAGRCGAPAERPWCDTGLTPEKRTELLLAALTLEEKIGLMAGDDGFGVVSGNPATGTSDGVPRVGLPPVYFSDGPLGPREGSATRMPSPLGVAAAFDTALVRRVGETIANEVRNKGNDVVHAPTLDIMRTPLAGRTFETFGEDPFLSARMGTEWVLGAQEQGVIGNVKHYAPNSQEGTEPGVPPIFASDGSRFVVDAVMDERTLREIYLPAFEATVKDAHAGSVMCAYNRVNGAPACESRHLLEDVLRRDWGFDGFVLSDYFGAVKSTTASALNGLDLELPVPIFYGSAQLNAAVASGQVTPATIDERVGNTLRTLFRFGFFDRADYPSDDALIDKPAHAEVAREAEEGGIVMLQNDGTLPLNAGALRSVALIGSAADELPGGGGSSAVTPFSTTTARNGIEARLGPGVELRYDPGDDAAAAAEVARGADVAIVVVADEATEGVDKTCLSLSCDGSKDQLVEAIAAANPNTVVVLETASPVLTPWRGRVKAVLEAWYPGQEGGTAIARVLFGDVDPGGRLPATFPREEGDIPTAGDPEQYPGVGMRAIYKEGVFVGYRHYDRRGIEPAFPFGHGLSYTTFAYRNLHIVPAADGSPRATVTVDVTNTGKRPGVAVPQLYLGLPSNPVAQPPRQLKGFAKLRLQPGRTKTARFSLDSRSFSYWDENADDWRVASGCHRVMLGSSSRRIERSGVIELGGARCPGAARACLAGQGFRSVGARPRVRGAVRFRFARRLVRSVDVTVLRQARGRRIGARDRRVIRFARRSRGFRWNGKVRGKPVRSGWYIVRYRMRLPGGRQDVRRLALRRVGGRFRRRPAIERSAPCGLVKSVRLRRAVFGGRGTRPVVLTYRLSARARVRVALLRGRRVVGRARTRRAGVRAFRLRLKARGLLPGNYRLRLSAVRGGRRVTRVVTARRL